MTPPIQPIEQRFWKYVEKTAGCWLWRGAINSNGYPAIHSEGRRGRQLRAHRVAYEMLVGPIPEGMQLDHLCEVKHCVNPDHLEPVLAQVNCERHTGKRITCAVGHPYQHRVSVVHGVTKRARWCPVCQEARRKERRRALEASTT
jgi:hypothetical protein